MTGGKASANVQVASPIDPVNFAIIRDRERHSQVFWAYEDSSLSNLSAELSRLYSPWQIVGPEEAQRVLRSMMEVLLCSIRDHVGLRESLRWLVLLRSSLSTFLGEFMDGRGYPRLVKADRLNVLRMLTIASIEYGAKKDYFSAYSTRVEYEGPLAGIVDKIQPLPDEEICALKSFLDRAMILHTIEKAYRLAGRGALVGFAPGGQLHPCVPAVIHAGLQLYDLRVNAQYANQQHLVNAGFPGVMSSEDFGEGTLFFVGRVPAENWQAAMEAIRDLDPGEFNPLNYFPMPIDARLAFRFLRRMPNGVAQRTGGLPVEHFIACLRALSHMHIEAYRSRNTRPWLGCFGFLMLPVARFRSSFDGHIARELPDLTREARQSIIEKFLRTFRNPVRTGLAEFDRSSVHRYMTASTAFAFVEADEAILFDSLYAHANLESWLVSLDVDALGPDDARRGVQFEEWVRLQVDQVRGVPQPLATLQGLLVRTALKDEFTDLDVVVALPPWLLTIQCKNRVMKDEHFRGVAQAVKDRWLGFHGDLKVWDDKMRQLFAPESGDWRRLNPELAQVAERCTRAIPLVVTPRTEWIPALTHEFLLHPGQASLAGIQGLPVPRICTFDDLKRLIELGGPKPPDGAPWVIRL